MQLVPVKNVIYLNSSQILPDYLKKVSGVRWLFAEEPRELKEHFSQNQGELYVIFRTGYLSQHTVQAFATWAEKMPNLSFIFIVQAMENAAYQMSLNNKQLLFVYESEGPRIGELVTRRLLGKLVKSRKQERVSVNSQVMLKKSTISNKSPTGGGVQFLKEGEMRDFSQGGARISLGPSGVKAKDFISLMYRNNHGRWVSVESQVRWVVSTAAGEQVIGVQFLALSA